MVTVIAIGTGLILGSFLSVLLARWPSWRGVLFGRSQCPSCGRLLVWFDLVPIVSWVTTHGRCRTCHAPIAPLYPILEITLATILGLYAWQFGASSGWQASDLAAAALLTALFFFDLKYQVLPDTLVGLLAALAILRLAFLRSDLLVSSLAIGALLAAGTGVLYFSSRGRWIGLGDVKLAFALGALAGFPGAIGVLILAVWAGALVGVGLILTHRATMQTALPFGSFWTATTVLVILWPNSVRWLSGLMY